MRKIWAWILPGKERVRIASNKLDQIAQKDVAAILDALRRARRDGAIAKDGLREAVSGQEQVIRQLAEILHQVQRDVTPSAAQRMIAQAIKKQQEALDTVKDTRLTKPTLEGKTRKQLNEEEKKALAEAAEKQKDATEELQKAVAELKAQAEQLKNMDAAAAEHLKKALEKVAAEEAEQKSGEAQKDVAENRLRSAEQKQEDVIAALKDAEKQLSRKNENAAVIEEKLEGLKDARQKQEQAHGETKNLDTKNDTAVAQAAQDQGQVSKALGALKSNDPALALAEQKSQQAADAIAQDKPQDAVQNQEQVLNALNDAIKKTESQLASADNRERKAEPLPAQTGKKPKTPGNNAPPPPKSKSEEQQAGVGSFQYGLLNDVSMDGWNVALPPRERAEVEQAIRGRMPTKYARQIKLYYMSLAGAKGEN